MRLLEKAPEARFQSALDVVWALEQVDTGAVGGPLVPRASSDSQHRWRPRSVVWATASGVRRAPAPYRLDIAARDAWRSPRPRIDAVYLAAAIRNGTWFRPDGFAGWPVYRFRRTK